MSRRCRNTGLDEAGRALRCTRGGKHSGEHEMAPAPVCAVPRCGRLAHYRLLCRTCYQRSKNAGTHGRVTQLPARAKACSVPGCGRPHCAKGLCNTHYTRVYRYGWPSPTDPGNGTPTPIGAMQPGRVCSVEACDRKHWAKGMCRGHYERVHKFGWLDPNTPPRRARSRKCEAAGEMGGVAYRCSMTEGHEGKHRMVPRGQTADQRRASEVGRSVRRAAARRLATLERYAQTWAEPDLEQAKGSHATGPEALVKVPPAWRAHVEAHLAWLKLRNISNGTIGLRIYHVRTFATAVGCPPWDVTTDQIMTWLGGLEVGPASKASLRASLRVFYTWAVESDRIARSPADRVPRIQVPEPRPKPVREDDYATALAAAPSPAVRMMLRLSGEMGMRRAEVARVHRDDIQNTDDGPVLRVFGKGSKTRHVPMPKELADELVRLIESTPGPHAFPGATRGHLTPHWVGTLVSQLLPEGYTMHKLRHRALTQAYRRTKDIMIVAAIAGHSSVATTQKHYVEADQSAMRLAVEAIAS